MQIAEESLAEFAKSVELTGTKFLEGFHRSFRSGSGVEFHELRAYSEGEDARFIDWKRLASTDRYLVRQFERHEKTSWKVWVDSSDSMTYGQKSLWSAHFAASLLYVAQSLGDSWALIGTDRGPLSAAYETLVARRLPGVLPAVDDLELKQGDRLVLVSDFFFDLDEMLQQLRAAHDQLDQILFVQILDSKEAHFDFKGVIQFDDRESPAHLVLDAHSIRSSFLKALADHQNLIRRGLTEKDSLYVFEDKLDQLPIQLAEFFGVS